MHQINDSSNTTYNNLSQVQSLIIFSDINNNIQIKANENNKETYS